MRKSRRQFKQNLDFDANQPLVKIKLFFFALANNFFSKLIVPFSVHFIVTFVFFFFCCANTIEKSGQG